MRIRPQSPEGVMRPFTPDISATEPPEQIADALDKIAISLASIDHNLEVLADRLSETNGQLQGLVNVVARRP